MPTKLTEQAVENSSFGIRSTFTEKTPGGDVPFTPNTGLTWSLSNRDGSPVNGKTDVPITPAPFIDIVLTGADLALIGGPVERYVTVNGTYDGVLGNGLPIVDEVSFQICNLKGKP